MKTILLPTDFSKNSMNAIDYAMIMFKNITCELYIINVQAAAFFISDEMTVVPVQTSIKPLLKLLNLPFYSDP